MCSGKARHLGLCLFRRDASSNVIYISCTIEATNDIILQGGKQVVTVLITLQLHFPLASAKSFKSYKLGGGPQNLGLYMHNVEW